MDNIVYENVNADELITFLKPVSGLGAVSEIMVKLSQDDISLRVVDPAHVAMVGAVWTTPTGQEMDIGIDYDAAMKALALFSGQDIRVTITDGSVIIKGKKGQRTVPRVDPDAIGAPREIPALNTPVQIQTTVADLRDAMKGVNGISDHLKIYTAGDVATIETTDDRTAAEFTIAGTVQSSDGDAAASYPWDYFFNVVKALTDGDLNISIGTDYPITIDATRGDIKQRYLIAPRIEQE